MRHIIIIEIRYPDEDWDADVEDTHSINCGFIKSLLYGWPWNEEPSVSNIQRSQRTSKDEEY